MVRDKVTREYSQTTIFQEKGEPKRIQTKVPLLNAVKIVTNFFLYWHHAIKNRVWGSCTHTEDDGLMDGSLELVPVLPQPHDGIVGVFVVAAQLLQPLVANILNVPQLMLRT